MCKNSETHEAKKTIVKFHTGRGGQFYNAGHLEFLGINVPEI